MKSLQSLYELERENIETVETDKYFFTFKMVEKEFHIFDVFIHPEFRSSEVSDELQKTIHEVAKSKGAEALIGFINKGANGNSRSLAYQLKHGMVLHSWDNERIVLYKGIS